MVDAAAVVGALPAWGWVVLGIGLYWLVVRALRRRGAFPEYVGNQGPILTLHTGRFREFVDRIASPRRAWRAWGNVGVGVSLVIMTVSFLYFALAAVAQFQNPPQPSAVNRPQNVLVIPGVNEFLPLSVAPEIVAGLLVGLVVHEGGHAVMCRVGDIEIESMGLALLAIVPVGAFVEPDEDSRRAADRGDQTRMFAAGVMNNFAITLLAFALLFGPVVGSIAVAPGAAVGEAFPDSPAAGADIGKGDRILAVGGEPVANNSDLEATIAGSDAARVDVRVDRGASTETVTVDRSVYVVGVSTLTPFERVGVRSTVVAVNGTPVATETAFESAVRERRVATLGLANGSTTTGPVGAAVLFVEDGPAARDGVPAGRAVVTAVDDDRVVSGEGLGEVLADTAPNQTVTLSVYRNGTRTVHDVELGTHPDGHGQLGVLVVRGYSGVVVNDFGVQLYPAERYLRVLGGDPSGSPNLDLLFGGRHGFLTGLVGTQFLPFIGLFDASLPYNFAGFTGGVSNFYSVVGPLSALGGLAFVLANVLFWIGWINLVLGQFNTIPAFPLDGGHILRTSTEAIVSRLPVVGRRELTRAVTTTVGLLMLASLVVLLFGPQLLR